MVLGLVLRLDADCHDHVLQRGGHALARSVGDDSSWPWTPSAPPFRHAIGETPVLRRKAWVKAVRVVSARVWAMSPSGRTPMRRSSRAMGSRTSSRRDSKVVASVRSQRRGREAGARGRWWVSPTLPL